MKPISPISLSELNGRIQTAISGQFARTSFWVLADVTNHTFRAAKNYHYFELVEKDKRSNDIIAKISGSAWGLGAGNIAAFELKTGQQFTSNIQVLVNVSVEFHKVYGLRINLNDIDVNFTLGALEQQKLATLDRLLAENQGFIERYGDVFLTRNRQLKLNHALQRIALITSATSAGAEDFKHTLEHNSHGYRFVIDEYLAGVQGENNAEQLVHQLVAIFMSGKAYDAVVITRGGGAQSDFLLFDNYFIGKAIARFPIPVITGIGHQRNETIADLMAHTPLKTPTRAAEFIIAHNRAFEEQLLSFEKTLVIKTQQFLAQHHSLLQQLAAFVIAKPRLLVSNNMRELSNIQTSLQLVSKSFLKQQRAYLEHYSSLVRTVSPENLLKKGFAIIKYNGKITSKAAQIMPGSEIDIIFSNKQITATVQQKTDYNGRDFNL